MVCFLILISPQKLDNFWGVFMTGAFKIEVQRTQSYTHTAPNLLQNVVYITRT